MEIINNRWVKVGQVSKASSSYILLRGIERVTIQGARSNEGPYNVLVYANGNEFLYKTESVHGDAENAVIDLLKSIDAAV